MSDHMFPCDFATTIPPTPWQHHSLPFYFLFPLWAQTCSGHSSTPQAFGLPCHSTSSGGKYGHSLSIQLWVQMSAPPLTGWVTLGNSQDTEVWGRGGSHVWAPREGLHTLGIPSTSSRNWAIIAHLEKRNKFIQLMRAEVSSKPARSHQSPALPPQKAQSALSIHVSAFPCSACKNQRK